ncbi:hypothetical protein CP972_22945 [Streptomyces prasinus]|uniref:Collagen-like protein n=1 Tax=Streptomyces prasinus TaxID=67345 RepID=A0ABX6AZ61_9ACTN|nr:hypothetical protein CP972_22945 [Streptomyces prasinus]
MNGDDPGAAGPTGLIPPAATVPTGPAGPTGPDGPADPPGGREATRRETARRPGGRPRGDPRGDPWGDPAEAVGRSPAATEDNLTGPHPAPGHTLVGARQRRRATVCRVRNGRDA